MARDNDERRRDDDEGEVDDISDDDLLDTFDDDDDDDEQGPPNCEVCGDSYDFGLTRCETCSWLMCESCTGEDGNCIDCEKEIKGWDSDDD